MFIQAKELTKSYSTHVKGSQVQFVCKRRDKKVEGHNHERI